MSKPVDTVHTRVEALSESYFGGNPSQASFERVEECVIGGFGRYATLSADAKEAAAERKALKEKMTPWLKVLRARLNAKGKKGEGWVRWCAEHKAEIGISRKTADRWIDGPQEEKKFANLDNVDGLKLTGKKYSYKVIVENDQIVRIDVQPEREEPKEAHAETAESVAPNKLDACSTQEQIDKFHRAYKRKHKDVDTGDLDFGSSKWAEDFFAALAAEAGKHAEWRKGTVDRNLQEVSKWVTARQACEEDQKGWTRQGRKKAWKHEDGRSIGRFGSGFITYDKDGLSIRDNLQLIDAMREKRPEPAASNDACPPAKTIHVTVINETREIQLPTLEEVV